MKTENQIELTQPVAPRRDLAVRTVVASFALATATLPAIAGDRSTPVTKEDPDAIRPFHVNVPEAELVELRRHINSTKWPEKETVGDASHGVQLATIAFAQSAKDIRGASPYVETTNEPAPKLIVDAPRPDGLAKGIFWAQYRVENVRIVPVFGAGAAQTSPRVGHLHIQVDDVPWWWADAGDNNTIDIAGLPPGQHKVKIQLVGANHNVFPGQVVTLRFTVPEYDRTKVYGHEH